MGCDVHMYCEVRDAEGAWQLVDEPRWRDWRDRPTIQPYSNRNYSVFTILAGVRGDNAPPIAEPRGIPRDVSCALARGHLLDGDGSTWLGEHSFSHLTLRELLAYDWHASMRHEGVIDLEAYRRWKAAGESWPNGVIGGIGGPGVVTLGEDELRDPKPGERVYVRFPWHTGRSEACRGFYPEVLDSLVELAGDRGVTFDAVRIVFGFDS